MQSRQAALVGVNLLVALAGIWMSALCVIYADQIGSPIWPIFITLCIIGALSLMLPKSTATISSGLLLCLIFIFARPSLLADQYPYLASVPALALFLRSGGFRVGRLRTICVWLVLIFIAELLPAFISRPGDSTYLLSSAASALFLAAAVAAAASNSSILRAGLDILAVVLGWEVVAFLVSEASGAANVTSWVPTSGSRVGWEYLMTPLFSVYGQGPGLFEQEAHRLTAWLPEPGVLAAFAVVLAFVSLGVGARLRVLMIIVSVATVLCAQSTAGVVALVIGASIAMLNARSGSYRILVRTGGAIVFLGAIVLLATGIGVDSKNATNTQSVSDRLGQGGLASILSSWLHAPFGTRISGTNAEINLLQSSVANGVLILLLWTAVYFVIPIASGARQKMMASVVALYATVLFSQPAYYEVWVLLAAMVLAGSITVGDTGISEERGDGELIFLMRNGTTRRRDDRLMAGA